MANGNYWLSLFCNKKSIEQLISVFFQNIFADLIIMLIFALTKKGLVAQLNSALDYGSRGYWFESSRGHKKLIIMMGFFHFTPLKRSVSK